MERTKYINKRFNTENGEELTQLYLKSDVLLLTRVFEKFVKVSVNKFGINPFYCVSLSGYTCECDLKFTAINLQALQDKDLMLTFEKNIRGGISSLMGDRYVKTNENKKIIYMDATNLNGHSMMHPLPYDESEMWHGHLDLYMNCLEEFLNTPDDSETGYYIEVDLRYPDDIKVKTKNFPFCPEKKVLPKD